MGRRIELIKDGDVSDLIYPKAWGYELWMI